MAKEQTRNSHPTLEEIRPKLDALSIVLFTIVERNDAKDPLTDLSKTALVGLWEIVELLSNNLEE